MIFRRKPDGEPPARTATFAELRRAYLAAGQKDRPLRERDQLASRTLWSPERRRWLTVGSGRLIVKTAGGDGQTESERIFEFAEDALVDTESDTTVGPEELGRLVDALEHGQPVSVQN